MADPLTLSDFDYALPNELIAQHPLAQRSASRLLDATRAPPVEIPFAALPQRLRAGDLLVCNDTRVIKARLFGVKASGGAVELLVERVLPGQVVLAHLRASKAPREGSLLRMAESFDVRVLGRGLAPGGDPSDVTGALYRLQFPDDPFALLERHGHVPLPPYIRHADADEDERRYQTVFAARPGAVAAPTASLHFDEALLIALRERGVTSARVTLHVGAGTFQPVRTESLSEHRMHSEWFEVSESAVQAVARTRAGGGRIVAAGTTTLRALESAARSGDLRAQSGETELFITPGFEFRVVDALITNFHLPRSTLLMLVSAFAGSELIRRLYAHAIEQRFRFFSYGDAMLLERRP